MRYDPAEALDLLRKGVQRGDASFREDQEEAIRHVVEGRGRLLLLQRTGWGKSFVYFIATKLMRMQGAGPAMLVSPLLSLMRNQIDAATRMGVAAARIDSSNEDEWDEIESRLEQDEIDILLVSPERFGNERFQSGVMPGIQSRVSLFVVDEAHCISDWGHDFRPDYRRITRIIESLPRNVRVLATTATANNRVMDDLEEQLGPDLTIKRGALHRPSLCLQTIRMDDRAERLAWLAERLPEIEGSGIIYTLTVRDAIGVAGWLRSRGLEVEAYTGQSDERPKLEGLLLRNEVKALVATTALGMGYDKPDLGFVIHFQSPGSMVAYYQQVGRAGRGISRAHGVLLSGVEDDDINGYFIETAFPSREHVDAVLELLRASPDGLSLAQMTGALNIARSRIEKVLHLLELESPAPIVKHDKRWQLTPTELGAGFWDRVDRLTDLRRQEQQEMRDYVALGQGHMSYLIRALDGDTDGIIEQEPQRLTESVDPVTVREAVRFLKRQGHQIEPRRKWPNGGLPTVGTKGNIPEEHRIEYGRALCGWRDGGWGEAVYEGKYSGAVFGEDLVEACVDLLSEWNPNPVPEWVTCVPSLRHPDLVPGFARRLADRLSLRFVESLRRTDERPEQKAMQNGAYQARNVDGAFEIVGDSLPSGPVLLVDDMVDSRWTLTMCGWLLRTNGAGPVFPLVLADAGRG